MLTKLTVLSACVALSLAGLLPAPVMMKKGQTVDESLHQQFSQFKQMFGKTYASSEEELARFGIFYQNLQFIASHNSRHAEGKETFTVGVNQFADMTNEEYRRWLGAPQEAQYGNASTRVPTSDLASLPASVNWVTGGLVGPVKDQKQCGSCWSFSATGALEGQHKKATKQMVSLSEQNLVDCSTKQGNRGCHGGWPFQAYEYIKENKGIDTEPSYPYTASQGTCKFAANKVGATLKGYKKTAVGSESGLQEAVANVGPVSVCIDASHMSFQLYKTGVYNEPTCSSTRLDHAVLAVGYGTENGKDYWLVKNSWNTNWGEKGYIKMTRNQKNQCGIAQAGVYPEV